MFGIENLGNVETTPHGFVGFFPMQESQEMASVRRGVSFRIDSLTSGRIMMPVQEHRWKARQ